jgi:hypothetical protein
MRDVKLANGLLWGVNGLLGAGILAFAWFFLLKDAYSLKGFSFDDNAVVIKQGATGGDDRVLKSLPNPLEKVGPDLDRPAAQTFPAVLKGIIPSEKEPKNRAAFIKSKTHNKETVVWVGEEIRDSEKAWDEVRGWKLIEVGKDWATFSNGTKTEKLTLDLSAQTAPTAAAVGPAGKPSRIGSPYQSGNFKSQLLSSDPNRLVYGLDPEEIEWAMQNQDSIMNESFTVSPSAAGGIKIDSVAAGSIGAARGLVAGDIVKEVNGQPLRSVEDIKTMMTSPAMRAQTGMRITVERAGKPVVIEYRPLPR